MLAIYKREMRSYFTTPIGYIFLAIFFAVSGAVFAYSTLYSMTADTTVYFTFMMCVFVVLLPLLTMKLFSEEKKTRTDQLLLTAPISIISMVAAKFLAAYTMFAGSMLVSSLQFLILYRYAVVKTSVLLGNLLAILLVGMVFIAVGTFVSSLAENQLAAAVGTIGLLFVLAAISLLNQFIPFYPIRFVLQCISVFSRFQNFTNGIFDIASIIYYLSVTAVFLFLTVRVYERRRWA